MLRTVQFIHTLNRQQIGGNAVYLGTHTVQHLAELLQIGFASSIVNGGSTFGQYGSHDDIGSTRNRGFIQQHISTLQSVGGNLIGFTFGIVGERGSQVLYTHKMRIQTTTSDLVSSRLGYHRLMETRHHRTDKHDRSTQTGAFLQEFVTLQIVQIRLLRLESVCPDILFGY